MAEAPSTDLDALGRELVTLYRQAVSRASGKDSGTAALLVSQALEAIQRAKRNLDQESSYDAAIADIAEARNAVVQLSAPTDGS